MDYFTTEIQSSTGISNIYYGYKINHPNQMKTSTGTWLLGSQPLSTWCRRMAKEEDLCQDKLSDIQRFTNIIMNSIKYDFCVECL